MISVLSPATERNGFKVLLIEDNRDEAELIEELLLETNATRQMSQRLSVKCTDRLSKAQQLLGTEKFDVILLDLSLPDSQDLSTIVKIQEYSLNTPIVVLTARNDEELALQSIQAGAQDYLVKRKIDSELLMRSIRYAVERQHNQEALQKSEEKYRSVVENSLVGIAIIAPPFSPSELNKCPWLEVNDALCDLLGYQRAELMEGNWDIFSCPEDWQATFQELKKILAGTSDGYVLDKRWRKKNGDIVYTRVSLRCIRRPDGTIDRMIKVVLDVSDRYRYEQQLKTSEEFLKHTINATPDPIFVKDRNHRLVVLNRAYCRFIGYSLENLTAKTDYDLFPKAEADIFWEQDELVFQTNGQLENEENFTDARGITHLIATKRSLHKDSTGNLFLVGVIRDMTERKSLEEALKKQNAQLSHQAYHDALTGLPNRKMFYEALNLSLEKASSNRELVALLFLDLDGFKSINDTLGHNVGDLLLKAVADRLKKCLRGSDIISRLGGDEFTVILPAIPGKSEAGKVAEKIRDAIKEPFVLEEHTVSVTTSIGISLYPVDSREQNILVKNADDAMYRAKKFGKNQYQFY